MKGGSRTISTRMKMRVLLPSCLAFFEGPPPLVLTGCLLASFLQKTSVSLMDLDDILCSHYQLIQIPATDLHIALIFVQTLGKGLHIRLAASGIPGSALRAAIVGLASHSIVRCLLFGWGAGPSKHSSDRVTDT